MENKNKIMFGSFNVETGEIQDGYMKNGEMKFKPEPWYKRWFRKRPEKTEYIGVIDMQKNYGWSDNWVDVRIALYKDFNPLTGEVYRVYAWDRDRRISFDVNAYLRDGEYIRI